jgi:hydroxymethylbilane synthase
VVAKKTLFISKNKEDIPSLIQFCKEKKIDLIAKSLITFKKIESQEACVSENIFFGSKNAFDYYIQQFEIPKTTKICCVGESTKKHIEKKNYKVDFYGKSAGDVETVSKDLNKYLEGKSICFVQSSASKKTIQKHVKSNKIQEITVYDTILLEKEFPQKFDCLIFTSPSNVEAFLIKNKLSKSSKLISWEKRRKKQFKKMDLMLTSA